MSEEIKLDNSSINEAINQLNTSIKALEILFNPDVKGNNVLETVDSMEEISQLVEGILASYQNLLIENVTSTRNSVVALEQTEKSVASMIWN